MFAKLLQKITAQQESSQVLSPNLISLNYCIANLIFILFVNVVNCMNLGNTCFDDDFFVFDFRHVRPIVSEDHGSATVSSGSLAQFNFP
jgi:hypothetical protein